MGDDFQYQYAETWFKQMDKLIHYVNKVMNHNTSQLLIFIHVLFDHITLRENACFPVF